ncbi:MAG: response regulator [Candidatus Omnitrophota bacterium]
MKSKPTILIVDDEAINIKLLNAILDTNGYEVLKASCGEEALQIVGDKDVDLILLDIMMPGLDGFEVTRRLRSDEKTQPIPIILVTALKETEDRINGIEAGGDDFIAKPFDKYELLARVKSLLKIKFLHEERDENYRKLMKLEKMKDTLSQMLVHDLKHPTTVISAMLQFLEANAKDVLPAESKAELQQALLATEELSRMTTNLLDIYKMEEETIKLYCEDFDSVAIVSEIVDQMKVVAINEFKSIVWEKPEDLPQICADKTLFKRIIANLINNALKFTPSKGEITIKALFDEKENNVFFQVSDTGNGIPENLLGKIFDKFFQVESSQLKTGRGLGLTFCKMAMDVHGGKIRVESEPGKGSVFTVMFPKDPKCIMT